MNKYMMPSIAMLCIAHCAYSATAETAKVNNTTKYVIEVEAVYDICPPTTGDNAAATYITTIQPNQTQEIPYRMGQPYGCQTTLNNVKITGFFDENGDKITDIEIGLHKGSAKTYTISSTTYGPNRIQIQTSQW